MEMNSMIQGGASITTNTTVAPEPKVSVNNITSTVVSSTSESATKDFEGSGSNPSDQMIEEAINAANARLRFGNNDCEFAYEKEINRIAIRVVNRETKEVIREIPSQASIEMLKKLQEMEGMLIDEKR